MKIRYAVGLWATMWMASVSFAGQEYLVRFKSHDSALRNAFVQRHGGSLEVVSQEGVLYKWVSAQEVNTRSFTDDSIAYVEKNHELSLLQSPSLIENRNAILKAIQEGGMPELPPGLFDPGSKEKPEIKEPGHAGTGKDPLLEKAWGMFKIGADKAWEQTNQGKGIVVAVTDSGVDYNHKDLIHNMWRNTNEIPNNKIDDDKNGYVDDIVGWDFTAANDNRPYDVTTSTLQLLFGGGNPGHGTHVSGVVGAKLNNGEGTAGVAPQVKIMALRFITESGKGDTAGAIKAIDYAVKNGANIINASWGGEKGDEDDKGLVEAIERARDKGVIFVAAAGNGRVNMAAGKAVGFDNDSDKKPMVPASFDIANIVAVAAIDSNEKLAEFSNWGKKSVRIAAPGVKIMSTVPKDKYQDTIIDLGDKLRATWDGTSMASPFVSGALAVIWSQNPEQGWEEVKEALLSNAVGVPALSGKCSTEGRVDLRSIK